MSKDSEQAELAADQIETMVDTLKQRWFTTRESVSLVCAMLSSSNIYIPFATAIAEERGPVH